MRIANRITHLFSLCALVLVMSCRTDITQRHSIDKNYALALDGRQGYVTIPASPALHLSSFTIEVMVRFEEVDGGLLPILTDADLDQWNAADGFSVMYEYGRVVFRLARGPREAVAFAQPFPVQPGTWYQISCAFDGQYGSIYIDGRLIHQDRKKLRVYYGDSGLRIGHGYHSQHGGELSFRGQIDEVRVWNHVRSEAQIRDHIRRPLRGNEYGLVGYWNFDERNGVLDPGMDYSVVRNHAQIDGRIQLIQSTAFLAE